MTSASQFNDVFPLPLSLFEQYMFMDDQAGNTMTLPMILRFRGQFDRQKLEDAYKEARQLHPLSCCVIDGQVWKPVAEPGGITWLDTKPENFPWTEQRIDITKTTGLRLAIFQDENSAEFHFLFHHDISDGLGMFQFFNSFFECYVRRIGQDIVPKNYDPAQLHNRENYELTPPPYKVPWYRSFQISMLAIIRWLRNCPLTPASKNRVQDNVQKSVKAEGKSCEILTRTIVNEKVSVELKRWNRTGYLSVQLSRETTSRILSELKKWNQTVAGYFLSRLFISLANSRSFVYATQSGRQKQIQPDDILRIGLVLNLRKQKAEAIPACNLVSYTFPTRRFGECLDKPEFYEGIAREIRYVRDWNAGMIFLKGLAIFRRLPFLYSRLMRSKRCLASAMFSSMNRCDALFSLAFPRDKDGQVVVGHATLIEFQPSIPYRQGTNLCVTTGTYAGSLGFFAQYDAEKIESADAVDWLTEWVEMS